MKRVLGRMNVGLAQQWMAKLEEKCRIGSDERKEKEKRSRRPPVLRQLSNSKEFRRGASFEGLQRSNLTRSEEPSRRKKKPTSQCDKEAVETQPKRFAQTHCG